MKDTDISFTLICISFTIICISGQLPSQGTTVNSLVTGSSPSGAACLAQLSSMPSDTSALAHRGMTACHYFIL